MDGVYEMLPDVQVEATFPDRTKLVTVHNPIELQSRARRARQREAEKARTARPPSRLS